MPALGALVAEPLYVLTDTAIVGHLGTPQLGGVGVATTVLVSGYAMFIFLAYGTTGTVARLLGAGHPERAASQGVQALWLALGIGVTVMYGTSPAGPALLIATALAATAGLAAAGALYGVLAAGLRVRDTLLPILWLPVVAPLLIGATQAFGAAYDRTSGAGWRWCGLLAAFALLYAAIGIFAFEPLLEES